MTNDPPIPQNLDAERGVIGACMYADAGQIAEVRLLIGKEDFFLPSNAEIFGVICDLSAEGVKLDAVTVYHSLNQRGILEEVGGAYEIGRAIACEPGSSALLHYAGIIREASTRRKIIAFSDSLRAKATNPANYDNSADIAQDAMGALTKLVAGDSAEPAQQIGNIAGEVLDEIGKKETKLIPTKWHSLNEAIGGGVGVPEMVIVGARPSMGKSLVLRQWAIDCALDGIPVGYISLEEGHKKIGRNALSYLALVDNKKIRRGNLNSKDCQSLAAAHGSLHGIPMYVTDSARRMGQIRAQATVWKHRYGIQLLFVDYLQRIRGVAGKDRYEVASNISTEVSDLLKDLQVGGIIAAQLNRATTGRDDKRPVMSDLRETGQIEQDADGIIMLHREDYYHLDESEYVPTRIAELIIAKWRDGERGTTVKLQSSLKHQRFIELSEAEPELEGVFG